MITVRSILKEKQLENEFLGEAVACSFYILNRSPAKSVKSKFPQEAWSGMKSTFQILEYLNV